MKYYFPTSTLNFDNILSSQMLAPSSVYRPDTLWWNRFEAVLGTSPDALVLYSKCPVWEMEAEDRDHYPLVLEIDLDLHREECEPAGCPLDTVEPGLEAVFLFKPLFFTASDFMKGRIRFLFRSEKEMNRITSKTRVGVAECKVIRSLFLEAGNSFAVIDPVEPRFALEKVGRTVADSLSACVSGRTAIPLDPLLERERIRGAELGYRLGRYVKSLQAGAFLDGFRFGGTLSFSEWCREKLPEPFRRILNRQINRGAEHWDPNRQALAKYCLTTWDEAFVSGGVQKGSALHLSLQNIARHWLSADYSYEVEKERNPFMQAFAVFMECGCEEKRYIRYLNDYEIALPELVLALYGATVGYTSFSRGLLENTVYLPEPEPLPEPVPPEKKSDSGTEKGSGSKKTQKKQAEKKRVTKSTGKGREKGSRAGTGAKALKADQQTFSLDTDDRVDRSLFVFDPDLPEVVRETFADLQEVEKLITILREFSKRYQPAGMYGRKQERYPVDNEKMAEHLDRCMRSKKTEDLKFGWPDAETGKRFFNFIRERYCR